MKRPRFNADALCFPIPPARIGPSLTEAPLRPAVAATYLTEIQRWRDAVVTALADGDPAITGIENFTARARGRLAMLLRTEWDARPGSWAAASDYNLTPFPLTRPSAGEGDPMKAVLEALHWRAAIIHYLTDIWDVMGRPELAMEGVRRDRASSYARHARWSLRLLPERVSKRAWSSRTLTGACDAGPRRRALGVSLRARGSYPHGPSRGLTGVCGRRRSAPHAVPVPNRRRGSGGTTGACRPGRR